MPYLLKLIAAFNFSIIVSCGYSFAQSTHIEVGTYQVTVPIGHDIARVKKCESGTLISGGYTIDNDTKNHRMIRQYPTKDAANDYWRVDIRNFGSSDPNVKFHIIVLCGDNAKTLSKSIGTSTTSTLLFEKVDQTVSTGSGPRDVVNVYKANLDGTGEIALTISPTGKQFDNFDPQMSPDGTKIAFATMRHREDAGNDNTAEIYLMDVDGSNQIRLSTNAEDDDGPRWCGSGRLIASSGGDIIEFDAADSDSNGVGDNLVTVIGGITDDYDVDCSPNGTKIVFIRRVSGANREIIVANRDGSGAISIGGSPAVNETPVWSPDGSRIAFASNRDDTSSAVRDLYIMDAVDSDNDGQGDNLERVTFSTTGSGKTLPSWSPDGLQLFFTSDDGSLSTIHIVDIHGFLISPPIVASTTNTFAGDWH